MLAVGGLIVATTWPENFGEQKDASPASAIAGGSSSAAASAGSSSASSPKRTFAGQLQHAASAIAADPKIALLGAMQALFEGTGFFVSFWRSVSWGFSLRRKKKSFEMDKKKKTHLFPFLSSFLSLNSPPLFFDPPLAGAMYTFVFLWTPALSPRGDEKVPHGFVFALFMVSSMAGSAFAGKLLTSSSAGAGKSRIRPERYMQAVFAAAAVALAVPALFHTARAEPVKSVRSSLSSAPAQRGISLQGKVQLLAFCAFEALVGVFWPSMMKMRSAYVPEESRATIINFFRIPLNAFVCAILYNVSAYPLSVMFGMCSLFLATAAVCQRKLDSIVCAEAAAAGGAGGLNSHASRSSPGPATRLSTATATVAMAGIGSKGGNAPQHLNASPARRV